MFHILLSFFRYCFFSVFPLFFWFILRSPFWYSVCEATNIFWFIFSANLAIGFQMENIYQIVWSSLDWVLESENPKHLTVSATKSKMNETDNKKKKIFYFLVICLCLRFVFHLLFFSIEKKICLFCSTVFRFVWLRVTESICSSHNLS